MIEFLKKLWQGRARARLKVAEDEIEKLKGNLKLQEERLQSLEAWRSEEEKRTLEEMIEQKEQTTYAQIMNEYFNGKEEDDG